MRVKPCMFLKTLVFQKNQEKDVWHALLSFQGTAPPGLSSPKAAPFHRRDTRKSAALRRTFQLIRLPPPSQTAERLARSVDMRRLTHRRTLWKEPTLAGEREYRGRRRPCQGISKKCKKANSDRPFLGVALHTIRCNFRPPFRAPRAPGQRPRDRPDAPPPGCAPTGSLPYLLEG